MSEDFSLAELSTIASAAQAELQQWYEKLNIREDAPVINTGVTWAVLEAAFKTSWIGQESEAALAKAATVVVIGPSEERVGEIVMERMAKAFDALADEKPARNQHHTRHYVGDDGITRSWTEKTPEPLTDIMVTLASDPPPAITYGDPANPYTRSQVVDALHELGKSSGGHMPGTVSWNMDKPANMPEAKELVKTLGHDSWAELAGYAEMALSSRGRPKK